MFFFYFAWRFNPKQSLEKLFLHVLDSAYLHQIPAIPSKQSFQYGKVTLK